MRSAGDGFGVPEKSAVWGAARAGGETFDLSQIGGGHAQRDAVNWSLTHPELGQYDVGQGQGDVEAAGAKGRLGKAPCADSYGPRPGGRERTTMPFGWAVHWIDDY
jgi:hypothetical protein